MHAAAFLALLGLHNVVSCGQVHTHTRHSGLKHVVLSQVRNAREQRKVGQIVTALKSAEANIYKKDYPVSFFQSIDTYFVSAAMPVLSDTQRRSLAVLCFLYASDSLFAVRLGFDPRDETVAMTAAVENGNMLSPSDTLVMLLIGALCNSSALAGQVLSLLAPKDAASLIIKGIHNNDVILARAIKYAPLTVKVELLDAIPAVADVYNDAFYAFAHTTALFSNWQKHASHLLDANRCDALLFFIRPRGKFSHPRYENEVIQKCAKNLANGFLSMTEAARQFILLPYICTRLSDVCGCQCAAQFAFEVSSVNPGVVCSLGRKFGWSEMLSISKLLEVPSSNLLALMLRTRMLANGSSPVDDWERDDLDALIAIMLVESTTIEQAVIAAENMGLYVLAYTISALYNLHVPLAAIDHLTSLHVNEAKQYMHAADGASLSFGRDPLLDTLRNATIVSNSAATTLKRMGYAAKAPVRTSLSTLSAIPE